MRPAIPWRVCSHCPWLHMFKSTFYNDLIITKTSSRKGIQYVGDITNLNVWRYYLCATLEGILETIEASIPWMIPSFFWSICSR